MGLRFEDGRCVGFSPDEDKDEQIRQLKDYNRRLLDENNLLKNTPPAEAQAVADTALAARPASPDVVQGVQTRVVTPFASLSVSLRDACNRRNWEDACDAVDAMDRAIIGGQGRG